MATLAVTPVAPAMRRGRRPSLSTFSTATMGHDELEEAEQHGELDGVGGNPALGRMGAA